VGQGDLVEALASKLGTKVVAFIVDRDPSTISRWKAGAEAGEASLLPLRIAYQVVKMLEPVEADATIRLVDPLPFLDVEAPETHEFLSEVLSSDLVGLGYEQPLDLSAVTNQDRRLSRLIAEFAYTATEVDGTPLYSGIRYTSRIASEWEC
jgi:hypothetical protein